MPAFNTLNVAFAAGDDAALCVDGSNHQTVTARLPPDRFAEKNCDVNLRYPGSPIALMVGTAGNYDIGRYGGRGGKEQATFALISGEHLETSVGGVGQAKLMRCA